MAYDTAELFPQYCQLPDLTPQDELSDETDQANQTPKGRRLLKLLAQCIDTLLKPPAHGAPQRVTTTTIQCDEEQRVMDNYPIITIPRITDAPPIMQSCNPMAKRALARTPCLHRQVT